MSSKRAILVSISVSLILLILVAGLNYKVDPMCYYQCDKIDLDKHTLNTYYQIGQKIFSHPKTELIILGSSRGQTTPPLWIEKKSGLKTLNLSMGGAELSAKFAFLNMALEKTQLKKVIWYADYFEFSRDIADVKIKSTPALRSYIESDFGKSRFKFRPSDLLALIDHNTLEASFYAMKNSSVIDLDQGSGSQLDGALCESEEFMGEHSIHHMQKETGFSFDSYTRRILQIPQSEEAFNLFVKKLEGLSLKGVEVLIIIPPYNPTFRKRLQVEYPTIYQNHKKWIAKLEALKIKKVKVRDFFEGLSRDDGSPRYWNDGVHFTCKGAIEMLQNDI